MTRITTLFLALTAATANAQLLYVTHEDGGQAVNNTMVTVSGTEYDALGLPLHCQLSGSSPKVVNLKRYEVEVPALTQNFFCWNLCYAPANAGVHPLWYADGPMTLSPGQEFEGFHAYYTPDSTPGTALFRYVWFDDMNPNDSVWVDVLFNAAPVGIEEQSAASFRMSAFPVPSNGGNVELNFDAPRNGQQAVVEFHDALGQLVTTERLRTGQQRLVMGNGRLPSGLVFATLRVDGRALATKRLVITGQ